MAPMTNDDFRIRRLRVGLTQQKLAELADCSIAAVRLYDSGYVPRTHGPALERVQAVLDEHERQVAK